MHPARNGFDVKVETEAGEAYYAIATDLWECPDCGHQIAHPTKRPYYRPDQEGFEKLTEDLPVYRLRTRTFGQGEQED